jgi:hypothetical protein
LQCCLWRISFTEWRVDSYFPERQKARIGWELANWLSFISRRRRSRRSDVVSAQQQRKKFKSWNTENNPLWRIKSSAEVLERTFQFHISASAEIDIVILYLSSTLKVILWIHLRKHGNQHCDKVLSQESPKLKSSALHTPFLILMNILY